MVGVVCSVGYVAEPERFVAVESTHMTHLGAIGSVSGAHTRHLGVDTGFSGQLPTTSG